MNSLRTKRVTKDPRGPRPRTRTTHAEEASSARDLARWILIIPLVWLLIFGSSALSAIGEASPTHINLLSNIHADYSPWPYAAIQPLREGFLDEIKHDYAALDLALSVFTQPLPVANPFIEPTEISISSIVEETPSSTTSSPFTATATVTEGTATEIGPSPTPSPTEDLTTSPTASLTPSETNTPKDTPTPSPSFTATPSPTSSLTPTPSPSVTLTPSPTLTLSPTLTPSITPSQNPTQPITICDPPWSPNYDYLHAHSPYVNNNIFGYIVHAMPVSGPETQVILKDVTIYQDAGNPTILEVTNINWYHTGMNIIFILVEERAETIYVPVNRPFYACYAAGQCDHSLYGGFIEAEFDDTLNGSYDIEITVNFPEYNQTCRITKGVTN